jgi:hypothetical protein
VLKEWPQRARQATQDPPQQSISNDAGPNVEVAAVTKAEWQNHFDVELKRRIDLKLCGPNGYRDDDGMLQWAQSELGVSPDEAQALWDNRYNKDHRAGRYKKAPAKIRKT